MVTIANSIQALEGHSDSIYDIAVSPDGKYAISGGGDDVAILWELESRTILCILAGHTDTVAAVGFNFDGTQVATAGLEGIVKVWTVPTGEELFSLDGPAEDIEWLKWHHKVCGW